MSASIFGSGFGGGGGGGSGGGIGPDTIINVGTVGAAELLTALTVTTPGNESGKFVLSVIKNGTRVPVLDMRPDQLYNTPGTAALPSYSFQGDSVANKTGMFYSQLSSALIFAVNGAQQLIMAQGSAFTMQGDTAGFVMGSISQVKIGLVDTFNALVASNAGNMQLGFDGALLTTATVGFLDLPTCPGTPTGVPAKTDAGHRSAIYDTTGGKPWIYDNSVWNSVHTSNSTLVSAPAASSSGVTTKFSLTPAADTGTTASTEANDVDFAFNRIRTWATGALTTQRAMVVRAPTYAFVGASTITNAATLAITDAPAQGTNATITNAYSLWTQAGSVRHDVGASQAVTVSTSQTGIQKILKLVGPASGDPAISWVVNGAEVAYLRALSTDMRFAVNGNWLVGDITETYSYMKIVAGGSLGATGIQMQRRLRTQMEANLASATTLTLGVSGNVFPITGSTTINGIVTTDFDAGNQIVLKLPSGITITHNSGTPGASAVAIQLKAGSNLTTSRVTFLPLCYDGTFFYEVG